MVRLINDDGDAVMLQLRDDIFQAGILLSERRDLSKLRDTFRKEKGRIPLTTVDHTCQIRCMRPRFGHM